MVDLALFPLCVIARRQLSRALRSTTPCTLQNIRDKRRHPVLSKCSTPVSSDNSGTRWRISLQGRWRSSTRWRTGARQTDRTRRDRGATPDAAACELRYRLTQSGRSTVVLRWNNFDDVLLWLLQPRRATVEVSCPPMGWHGGQRPIGDRQFLCVGSDVVGMSDLSCAGKLLAQRRAGVAIRLHNDVTLVRSENEG